MPLDIVSKAQECGGYQMAVATVFGPFTHLAKQKACSHPAPTGKKISAARLLSFFLPRHALPSSALVPEVGVRIEHQTHTDALTHVHTDLDS